MIKTIKVKKKLRLDELIKYVRDNGINSQAFVSDAGRASVYFDSEQNISLGEYTYGELNIERTFTVEAEEEITDDTVFETLVIVRNDDEVHISRNDSMSMYDKDQTKEFHALIDGKLELVWEVDRDEL